MHRPASMPHTQLLIIWSCFSLSLQQCKLTVGKEGPKQTGFYVVALQIEDFKDNSDTPMSSIPLQFLVEIYDSTDECGAGPVFVPPTPEDGETVDLLVGSTWTQDIVATSEGR